MRAPMWFCSHQFLVLLGLVSSSHVIILVLANNSIFSSQPTKSCLDHEMSALLQFKLSFIIDCTSSPDPHAHPKLNSWGKTSGDCCMWEGVMCDNVSGHVTALDLSSSCLYGTFPIHSTLFELPYLESLNLSHNHFNYSTIPTSIGKLDKLSILNLSNSFFSGQIPSEITKLSSLSILDLALNLDPVSQRSLLQLRDPGLKELVGNLTSLNELHLAEVDISSTVPTSLENMTSLRAIMLGFCNLHGEFPSGIFNLPNLETISLPGNPDLVGSLPEFHPNSPLKIMDLYLSSFSGELPHSIGYLGSLERLLLWRCHFSGTIPSTIGNLTKLAVLDLVGNNFTGSIPFSITNLTQLYDFEASYLEFRYTDLMAWLPKLTKLTILGLRGMGLVGEIPSSLANLTNLIYLDLSENHLRGSIPSWFANLSQLNSIYLDGNELEGTIPSEIFQLSNLEDLILGYNNGLSVNFNSFLTLKKLTSLDVSGVDITFPSNISSIIQSSSVKFTLLALSSCNLTEFPDFLRGQDELKVLYLSMNGISGKIPQWFANVSKESLLALDLSHNSLTGFEQPLSDLPWNFLKVLDLTGNKFQGLLPNPSSSMLVYKVSDNQFTGVIPNKVCNVSALEVLDLSGNKLSGTIPECLGDQLPQSLLVLNLRGNSFSSSIPEISSESCNLKMINLGENQLEGNLPRSLANCAMLEVLDIGRNSINDTFPSWLGSLSNLQVLVLRHNRFQGDVPSPQHGFVFPSLRIIDLSHNFYTGDFPSGYLQHWSLMKISNDDRGQDQAASSGSTFTVSYWISGLSHAMDITYVYSITIANKGNEMLYPKILNVFRVIDFSSNKFTGRILESMGTLRGLDALNLSNNNLEGGIPASLADIKGLESLDLSENMLSGGIPQELSQLTYLEVFDVSHNKLVGPVPEGGQFNTFDNSSFEGNLGLCGNPLSKKCGYTEEPEARTDHTGDESEKLVGWIIKLLGCLSGFVVGFILGKLYITDKYHEWFVECFGRSNSKKRRRRSSARRG